MIRGSFSIGVILGIMAVTGGVRAQTIFSPSQADFLTLQFADFVDNPEPDMAALDSVTPVGDDAVVIQFDTDFDENDSLWRVAMETPCDAEGCDFAADLTGLEAFAINFSNPVIVPEGISAITAQIFVRTGEALDFFATGATALQANNPITVSLPVAGLTNPQDVRSFGIELFGGDEFLGGLTDAMVTASTTPQPPTLVETTLYSWETPDDAGTPDVDERFEGWENIQPDGNPAAETSHSIVETGATDGQFALQLERQFSTTNFEWGSRREYTVESDGQEAIDEIVDIVNGGYSIAFDVTFDDQINTGGNTGGVNPGYEIFDVYVQDGTGAFFQASQLLVPGPNVAEETMTTVEFLLSDFIDQNNNASNLFDTGLMVGTDLVRLGLSTNLDAGWTFQIDNFRVRSAAQEGLPGDYNEDGVVNAADYVVWRNALANGGSLMNEGASPGVVDQEDYNFWVSRFGATTGSGAAAIIPEPASLVLLLLGLAGCAARRR